MASKYVSDEALWREMAETVLRLMQIRYGADMVRRDDLMTGWIIGLILRAARKSECHPTYVVKAFHPGGIIPQLRVMVKTGLSKGEVGPVTWDSFEFSAYRAIEKRTGDNQDGPSQTEPAEPCAAPPVVDGIPEPPEGL